MSTETAKLLMLKMWFHKVMTMVVKTVIVDVHCIYLFMIYDIHYEMSKLDGEELGSFLNVLVVLVRMPFQTDTGYIYQSISTISRLFW